MELLAGFWWVVAALAPGAVLLALRRRVPRWLVGAWLLLPTAIGLCWAAGLLWLGVPGVYLLLLVIGAGLWLSSEERERGGPDGAHEVDLPEQRAAEQRGGGRADRDQPSSRSPSIRR